MERAMRKLLGLGLVMGMVAGTAFAKDVPVEVSTLEGTQITLHVHPFLTDPDLQVLRQVASNPQALAVFVPGDKSHYAAMALAPKDGFLKDGAPTETAIALSDFPDAAAAAKAVTEACDAKRGKKGKPCVIVLEIGPIP
jgi:hypothetical protein